MADTPQRTDPNAPVLVVGLGRFGAATAEELVAQGRDGLAELPVPRVDDQVGDHAPQHAAGRGDGDARHERGGAASDAEDGAQGVERAKSELPDIILMDVVMPNLNGFQATRQLSKDADTSHIPVIIVTTKDQETDKVWGKRQGAKDYIVKPPREQDLIERINALVGH